MSKIKRKRKPITAKVVPAIPPNDYKGSVGNWITKLIEKGYWDGENPDWHRDVRLTPKEYSDLLNECES